MKIKAPFPWFGGKSTVAGLVWSRFGDATNYVEPFFGSGAVLLSRPHWPFAKTRIETVNDRNGYLCNFWRAIQAAPEAVAKHADWPVNELDLHARHAWLINTARAQMERLREEPDFYDSKIAGWWVWGICQWIGSGWCSERHYKRSHLGDAGRGVHRPWQQLPHLGDAGRGVHRTTNANLYDYFAQLSNRLRAVRVCCGDWSRVCVSVVTVRQGDTAVFLDPPYSLDKRDSRLYAEDEIDLSRQVFEWCKEWGHDQRMRIALCGYAGEGHEKLEQLGWDCVECKSKGGYGSQGADTNSTSKLNRYRERIWFSPHCVRQPNLFSELPTTEETGSR